MRINPLRLVGKMQLILIITFSVLFAFFQNCAKEDFRAFDASSNSTDEISATASPLDVPPSVKTPVPTFPTPSPLQSPVPEPTAQTSSPEPLASPISTPQPTTSLTPAPSPIPTVSVAPSPTPSACGFKETAKKLKIIFMVDNSGSTASTDPMKYYRIQAIRNFISKYGDHTNLTFAFGYFSGANAYLFDTSQNGFVVAPMHGFFPASDALFAVNSFSKINSSGSTPYGAAFNALQAAVKSDINQDSSDYVIAFLSDGAPTDLSISIDINVTNLVKSLRNAAISNGHLLSLSSIYFGPESDSKAQSHLKRMASEGLGQYIDTNLSNSLQIEDVVTVPGCL